MKHLKGNKGAALIMCYLIIALMLGMGSATVIRGTTEQHAAQVYKDNLLSVQLAESALDQAIVNLENSSTEDIAQTSFGEGSYWAEITPISGSLYQIDAHGAAGNSQRNIEVIASASGESVFKYALFGDDYVYMKKGSFTDSYDSSEGSYDPDTAGDEGDVGTNSIAVSSIEIKQGSTINGQLIVGPDIDDPEDAVDSDGSNVITGDPDVVSSSQEQNLPDVDITGLSCASSLSIGKNVTYTFTAAASPYCYNSISTNDGSRIRVSGGSVKVFANTINFDKSLDVNSDGSPTQFLLQIYGTSDIEIDKEGTFIGAIYAPDIQIRLKKAMDFYGSIVAESVYVDKESEFHYDSALLDIDDLQSGNEVEIQSWREYE